MLVSLPSVVKGLALGSGLMYFCDPQLGRQRREQMRDALANRGQDLEEFIEDGLQDLQQRWSSLQERVSHQFTGAAGNGASGAGGESHGRQTMTGDQSQTLSPGMRLVIGTVGCGMIVNCLTSRSITRYVPGVLGVGLLILAAQPGQAASLLSSASGDREGEGMPGGAIGRDPASRPPAGEAATGTAISGVSDIAPVGGGMGGTGHGTTGISGSGAAGIGGVPSPSMNPQGV